MAITDAALREHGDGLNTLFNAQQAELLIKLINAAVADGTATALAELGIPEAPAGDGDYNLTIASGEASWTADV